MSAGIELITVQIEEYFLDGRRGLIDVQISCDFLSPLSRSPTREFASRGVSRPLPLPASLPVQFWSCAICCSALLRSFLSRLSTS